MIVSEPFNEVLQRKRILGTDPWNAASPESFNVLPLLSAGLPRGAGRGRRFLLQYGASHHARAACAQEADDALVMGAIQAGGAVTHAMQLFNVDPARDNGPRKLYKI